MSTTLKRHKWKLAVKSRLREVWNRVGTQTKLAKRWGNGGGASQISQWCNDNEDVLPSAEYLALLRQRVPGVSIDWLLCGPQPATVEAVGGEPLGAAALQGLLETLPEALQAHLVFEYRYLVTVVFKVAGALAERRKAQALPATYREAGRLVGKCLAAPLAILGATIPGIDNPLVQTYVTGAAHAVELLAPYTRPHERKASRRKPKPPARKKQRQKQKRISDLLPRHVYDAVRKDDDLRWALKGVSPRHEVTVFSHILEARTDDELLRIKNVSSRTLAVLRGFQRKYRSAER